MYHENQIGTTTRLILWRDINFVQLTNRVRLPPELDDTVLIPIYEISLEI